MKPVEIYTTPICGFCTAAKRLLDKKSVAFTEYDVMTNPDLRSEMTQRSNGGRTVPQIFIDGAPIGGYRLETAAAHHLEAVGEGRRRATVDVSFTLFHRHSSSAGCQCPSWLGKERETPRHPVRPSPSGPRVRSRVPPRPSGCGQPPAGGASSHAPCSS